MSFALDLYLSLAESNPPAQNDSEMVGGLLSALRNGCNALRVLAGFFGNVVLTRSVRQSDGNIDGQSNQHRVEQK
jgi:hypothetical protein